jgi:hypothetical protein
MKTPIPVLAILLLPAIGWATHATGNDDSMTAAEQASCNASFQADCPTETTESIHSDSVAAPVGVWAESTIETLVLIVLLGSTLTLHVTRRRRAQEPNATKGGLCR